MFKDEWLTNPKYFWVRRSDKKTEFTCALCQSTCKLSYLGSAALDSHAKGQKHIKSEQRKHKKFLHQNKY